MSLAQLCHYRKEFAALVVLTKEVELKKGVNSWLCFP